MDKAGMTGAEVIAYWEDIVKKVDEFSYSTGKKCSEIHISSGFAKMTFDLINELKIENEFLRASKCVNRAELTEIRSELEWLKAKSQRFLKEMEVRDIMIEQQDYKIEVIKSEAIKEFLRRIEKYFDEKEEDCCGDCGYPPVSFNEISDIAKEMMEVINENDSN